MSIAPLHVPVLTEEVVTLLAPERGGLFVDCTVGAGGHSAALLKAGATRLLCLDRDPAALSAAMATLSAWKDRVELIHADYRDLAPLLDTRGIDRIDGAIADLGVSSLQLEEPGRGFSFQRDEPLDMRMDPTSGPTAADLVNRTRETELADAIFKFGEERASRRIARFIVEARERQRVTTTGQLAAIVRRAVRVRGHSRIDPATRTFQALRIWVNRELEGLDTAIRTIAERLHAGRRLAVIAFHSLEDRLVKHTLKALEGGTEAVVRVLTRKPIVATDAEVRRNPRARSAKLRVAERLA